MKSIPSTTSVNVIREEFGKELDEFEQCQKANVSKSTAYHILNFRKQAAENLSAAEELILGKTNFFELQTFISGRGIIERVLSGIRHLNSTKLYALAIL